VLGEYIYLGDQLLAMIRPGEVAYYFHNDHLGTPQVLTNDGQTIAWKAAYTAFGQAAPTIQTVENPFRFPGQYYDQETGLHYNYHRYYDPITGRYVTPDPIGLNGGTNLFVYVENNPLKNIDPIGLFIYLCGRKGDKVPGNHVYFWDDRPGTSPENRSCSRTGFFPTDRSGPGHGNPNKDKGPGKDLCNLIQRSNWMEDILMECCRRSANDGYWKPWFNDCFTALDNCIEEAGLVSPGAPVNRTEKICNDCEHGTSGSW